MGAYNEGSAVLGRRDIVVALQDTVKLPEFVKAADLQFASAATVLDASGNFLNAPVHRARLISF